MANGSLPSSKFQPITASLLFLCCSSRVKACTKGQSSTKFDHDSLSLRLKNTLNPPSAELELFKMDREQGHLSYISVRNSAVRGFNPNHTNVSKKALQNWTMCDYRRLKFVVRTDFFTFFFLQFVRRSFLFRLVCSNTRNSFQFVCQREFTETCFSVKILLKTAVYRFKYHITTKINAFFPRTRVHFFLI